MDIMAERHILRALWHVLGDEIWKEMSRLRKLALLEIVEKYGINMLPMSFGVNSTPSFVEIEESAKKRAIEIDQAEIIAILKNDIKLWPTLYMDTKHDRMSEKIFQKHKNRMEKLILELKNINFEHPEMEKRRLTILEAIENRISIPSDEYDLWVLNHVIPGIIDNEVKDKIDKWVEDALAKE